MRSSSRFIFVSLLLIVKEQPRGRTHLSVASEFPFKKGNSLEIDFYSNPPCNCRGVLVPRLAGARRGRGLGEIRCVLEHEGRVQEGEVATPLARNPLPFPLLAPATQASY